MNNINPKTIVFITGAFVSHTCWDQWVIYYTGKGYKCIVSPWPHKEQPAEVLRNRQPDAGIASIRLTPLINHFAGVVNSLPEKPIVIGHSLGGLIAQILLNRDLAAAAVAIHSVTPQGIIPTQWSFYRSTWKSLGLFTSTKKSFLMSFKNWQYAFTNGMSLAEQKAAYDEFVIPESKLCLRDGLTSAAKVDFKKPHGPLLFVAGNKDHCVPASLNKTNFKNYKDKSSITEYKLFEGRNHFVLGQPTWQENAAYILNWLEAKLQSPTKEQAPLNQTV